MLCCQEANYPHGASMYFLVAGFQTFCRRILPAVNKLFRAWFVSLSIRLQLMLLGVGTSPVRARAKRLVLVWAKAPIVAAVALLSCTQWQKLGCVKQRVLGVGNNVCSHVL